MIRSSWMRSYRSVEPDEKLITNLFGSFGYDGKFGGGRFEFTLHFCNNLSRSKTVKWKFTFRYFLVYHKASGSRYSGEVLAISHRDFVLQSCDFFFRGLMKYMVHLNSLAWKISWKGYLANIFSHYSWYIYSLYIEYMIRYSFHSSLNIKK